MTRPRSTSRTPFLRPNSLNSRTFSVVSLIVLSLFGLLSVTVCSRKDPILIGLSGPMEGRYSDLGVQVRNGVRLFIEEVNDAGGLRMEDGTKRRVRLVIRDDGTTPEEAVKADRELFAEGVSAILGHMLSSQSIAALSALDETGLAMVSPTSTTDDLSGRDDGFFRIIPSVAYTAAALAEYTRDRLDLVNAAVITDSDNAAFTDSFAVAFIREFEKRGGAVAGEFSFSSGGNPDFRRISLRIQETDCDLILIAASARDTVNLLRDARALGVGGQAVLSRWSRTPVLLQFGGAAVENALTASSFPDSDFSPRYREFVLRYQDRFGTQPSFFSALGYEAAGYLATGLERTGGSRFGLRQALRDIRAFEGLMGTISLDEFGDARRTLYIEKVRGGRFVPAGQVN